MGNGLSLLSSRGNGFNIYFPTPLLTETIVLREVEVSQRIAPSVPRSQSSTSTTCN
ncbi:hypothetical protein RintRC_6398 [Richelia intracellularis]|nr:hypothetical protein RintRC_6398 [Richelia intracellularis]